MRRGGVPPTGSFASACEAGIHGGFKMTCFAGVRFND